jgi:NAD(P)-dependent dehydrogenase (short-subunit alcohol dehydrogenase family)
MEGDFARRTVIVTGGSNGIGRAYVDAFRSRGANVAIADLRPPNEPVEGDGVLFVATDVSDRAATETMVETVEKAFGGVDVLVNNAALYHDLGRKLPFDEIDPHEWDAVMAVNVRGTWECTRAVSRLLKAQGHGKVVNIASTVAFIGSTGFAHYVASKAAVIGLTRALARELGPYKVTVNAVAPGLVANDATNALNDAGYISSLAGLRSIARDMTADDLVGTVLFLASPASNFVSGQTFVVDGGHYLQ